MGRIWHHTAAIQARKRPLLAWDGVGWGVLVLLHRQNGFLVVQVRGRVWSVLAVCEELHLDRSIGLKGDGNLR